MTTSMVWILIMVMVVCMAVCMVAITEVWVSMEDSDHTSHLSMDIQDTMVIRTFILKADILSPMGEEKGQVHFHQGGIPIVTHQVLPEEILISPPVKIPGLAGEVLQEFPAPRLVQSVPEEQPPMMLLPVRVQILHKEA